MKTTLNLNDTLLIKAKTLAVQQHISLTRLIEEGLKLRLDAIKTRSKTLKLLVHHGKGGLKSGLSGLSNKALLEAADHDA
jgi:hypothetical protein